MQHCGWGTKANEPHCDESQKVVFGENVLLHMCDHLPHSPKAELEMGIKQIKIEFLSQRTQSSHRALETCSSQVCKWVSRTDLRWSFPGFVLFAHWREKPGTFLQPWKQRRSPIHWGL